MFIKLHGPPLAMSNPNAYIKTWLRSHIRASDMQIRTADQKATTKHEDSV